jgi:hypothetical protein
MKPITKKEALQTVLEYFFEEEKRHLEEHIGTVHDVEDDMTEDELYKFCIDNGVKHIWTSLYILAK